MVFCLTANSRCVSPDTNAISKELKTMEKDIPLPYDETLDEIMKQLANKNLPKTFKDYEAFVDSALLQRDMPMELKYLPYALSEMKVNFIQGDRCGYWALPSLIGMHYGLHIDENGDERFSVESSTLAALNYLNDLYKIYNNWWYSILAYTNSPTSLSHMLIHNSSKPKLWDIYEQHLMPRTSVIPDFIACVYLGNEDRLKFSSNVEVAELVEAPIAEVVETDQTAVVEPVDVPTTKVEKPVEAPATKVVEPKQTEVAERSQNVETQTQQENQDSSTSSEPQTIKYKIKKGDTLWSIATKHNVTVKNLMEWNHLKNDIIIEGQTLIINKQ